MEKTYAAKEVENKWNKIWTDKKTFSAKPDKNKKPFTIVIPPPNITGVLHIGHALNNTLQDIVIRYKKMRGFNTLWVPGTDHGGIATQSVVEKILKQEKTNKFELGREKFLERMWTWRVQTGDAILDQLKKLGCALDWDRVAFTMDEKRSLAVKTAFIKLFDKGLIYRGERLVNWCPHCLTALSDIEVEYEQEKSSLWHIKYPFKDKSGFVIVATTRPETMLGDTAVAVHPNDERYIASIKKALILPLVGREIHFVEDFTVDKSFGTGAVKVTPAHDAADDAIAKRHNLEYIQVIDIDAKMINVDAKYKGLTVAEARKAVVEDLQAGGFLEKVEDYSHSVGRCYRCGTTIEPLMSEQWFVNVENMSKRAIEAAESDRTKFYPAGWKKPYVLWLENLRDWCISRQIWWGHRIPVYYCADDKGIKKSCPPIAAFDEPNKCSHCGGQHFIQDEDVLDTWFSSALWPMSVFSDEADLNYFYPTSALITGYEILYLWVARMVQFGLEFMDDIPYSDIFLTGIVRDKKGKKMSKSLGNVIDPLEIMDKFGTDALRFTLSAAAAPGRDMHVSDENFLAARNFANKIWNASRFIIMNSQDLGLKDILSAAPKAKELADFWILAELKILSERVKNFYEVYEIDRAARDIYDFFWTKYCDWYIELSKIRLGSGDAEIKKQALTILVYVLKNTLQLLSPIMPFITAEIWEILHKEDKSAKILCETLIEDDLPQTDESVLAEMEILQNIIVAIRTLRSEMNIAPSLQIEACFNVLDAAALGIVKGNDGYIKTLAKISEISFGTQIKRPQNSALIVAGGFEIFIPLSGIIDFEKEKARLLKELGLAKAETEKANARLSDKNFAQRAPQAEIEKIKVRLRDAQTKIEKIGESLKFLG